MNEDIRTATASPRSLWLALLLVLLIAVVARGVLLAGDAVSFHADEAVVGLMARHILEGERPVFFYGQAYMGSLDAWLIAGGFALLGESVLTIRIVQSALYLGVVAASFLCAWLFTRRVTASLVTGLLFAIPPTLVALYTTATLGGYNETMLCGTLIIILAYTLMQKDLRSWWRWAGLGLCAGFGWWTNGLIVIYAVPAAGLLLFGWARAFRKGRGWPIFSGAVVATAAFLIGSAPWWIYALQNDLAPLRFYLGGSQGLGADIVVIPFGERLIGLFFLGLPALFGLRFPWSAQIFLPPVGIIVTILFTIAVIASFRQHTLSKTARGLLFGMIGWFTLVYLGTRFSSDPTGRYFLPLTLPLFIFFGTWIASISRRWLQIGLTAIAVSYFGLGQITAISTPPGLTTQFNLTQHIANDHDAELIAFLEENDLTRGYAPYWISFRLAFLSGDELQYSAALPDKPNAEYRPMDERYPPYRAAADATTRFAIITAEQLGLDERVLSELEAAGVIFQTQTVGSYRVYYNFEPQSAAPRPPF